MEAGSGQPLLRLGSSVRYLLDKQSKLVTIGPLNQSWRGLFKLHAKGFDIDVSSARARKFHFAVRMPLAGGTTKLHVPARPVVGPVYELEKANIVRNMRLKILDNVYRYLTNKPKDYDRSVESTGITI